MRVKICEIEVELESQIPAVCQEWREIFANHQSCSQSTQLPQIQIKASAIDSVPPATAFKDHQTFNSADGTYTRSQNDKNQTRLDLATGAVVVFSVSSNTSPIKGELFLPDQLIHNSQIEDITLTLLAPIFRTFGIFIVHAFGAVYPSNKKAAIIIGPSGSGKTTSGLSLVEDRWWF